MSGDAQFQVGRELWSTGQKSCVWQNADFWWAGHENGLDIQDLRSDNNSVMKLIFHLCLIRHHETWLVTYCSVPHITGFSLTKFTCHTSWVSSLWDWFIRFLETLRGESIPKNSKEKKNIRKINQQNFRTNILYVKLHRNPKISPRLLIRPPCLSAALCQVKSKCAKDVTTSNTIWFQRLSFPIYVHWRAICVTFVSGIKLFN